MSGSHRAIYDWGGKLGLHVSTAQANELLAALNMQEDMTLELSSYLDAHQNAVASDRYVKELIAHMEKRVWDQAREQGLVPLELPRSSVNPGDGSIEGSQVGGITVSVRMRARKVKA